MRSLLLLGFAICFLVVSFRSCSWSPSEPPVNETAVAPSGPSPAPRVRSLPGSGKRNAYPMAEEPARPFNSEMPRTDIAMAALAALPKAASLRKEVAANPHEAPASLLNGLPGLSEMADLARRGDDKEGAEEAARFFTACALDEQTASAVRAVCVRHLWDLKGQEATISLNDRLPQRIKNIAGRLPSIR